MNSNLTPCKNKCRYDDNGCIDCKRTLVEISNWNKYSEDEKLKIINELYTRGTGNYYGQF
jgi:predicted Fe-S protein YdhL (DUF1289 family)